MELTQNKALRSESFTLTATEPRLKLAYLPVGVGLYNKGSTPADLMINPYTGDVITVEPKNYREIPISSSEFKLLTDGEVVVTTFFTQASVEGQRPYYPGFGAPQSTVNPYQYRDGFFYTPTSSRLNTEGVQVKDLSVYEIQYFVLGELVATTAEAYQETLVARVMDKLIQARNSGYFQDVVSLYEALSLPINKEFIGGASLVESYDTHLAHTTVRLNGDLTKYAFIFQTLGCTINVNSGSASVRVATKEDLSDAEVFQVNAGAPLEITRAVRYFNLEGTPAEGQEVTLTFSGHKAQVLQYAPFLNLYYPIGVVPGETDPINFKPWLDEQKEFLDNLQVSLFTGRVVYYREAPQETEHRAVWNADFITYNVLLSEWKILDPIRRAQYPLFNFEPPSYRDPLFIDRTSRRARGEQWRNQDVMNAQAQRIFEKLYIFDGPYAIGRIGSEVNGERGNHQSYKVDGTENDTFSYSVNDEA